MQTINIKIKIKITLGFIYLINIAPNQKFGADYHEFLIIYMHGDGVLGVL